jgi:hypothetical protein
MIYETKHNTKPRYSINLDFSCENILLEGEACMTDFMKVWNKGCTETVRITSIEVE